MEKEVKTEISESQVKDICFIITPIGDEGSVIRKKTDGLIDNVLEPVCNELNMEAIPAHKIDKLGSITNQVVQSVLDSKMVIANLTGLNPNVMYELAIRHAIKKPVVCIAEHGTKLPFDITTERTIFYSDDMYGATKLRSELKDKLQAALSDGDVDNPIYRAKTESMIIKDIQSSPEKGNSDSLLYILQRLDNIENAIRRNVNFNFKENKIRHYSFINENDDSILKMYTMTLSKPCSNSLKDDLINYLNSQVEQGKIVRYKISDKEINLFVQSGKDSSFLEEFRLILREKYKIEVKAIISDSGKSYTLFRT